MEFDTWLTANGFDAQTISPTQRGALNSAWRASLNGSGSGADVNDLGAHASILAKYERQTRPQELAGLRAAFQNAVNSGGTSQAIELACIRASRAQAGAGFSPYISDRPAAAQSDVYAAGICSGLGMALPSIGKMFGDHVADRVSHRDLRGLTLHGLARMRLQEAGSGAPPGRLGEQALREALSPRADTGPSTVSIGDILSNVANKFALQSFSAVPVAWPRFCRVGSLPDFKPSKLLRLTGKGTYSSVPPGGELKHISLEDSTASNQLDTQGALLSMDRRDIINDDLSMLAGIPKILGRQGALAVEKSVFTLLLENAGSFFGSGNKNVVTTGSVLSISGLTITYQQMTQQLDGNNDPVMVQPEVLLVPPALEIIARQLTRDTNVAGTASVVTPNSNPFAGMFDPVVSAYLAESTALHANADDDMYYLLAGPGDYSAITVDFLDGNQAPTIEQDYQDFDMLGLVWRAVHDFGAAFLEPRGGIQASGAGA